MKDTCATKVLPIEEFRKNSSSCWTEVRQEASQGLSEPVQVLSFLTFCMSLDQNERPIGTCVQAQAKYAVLAVTVRDLGAPADLSEWEPLCERGVVS